MTTQTDTNPFDIEGPWSIDTRCIGCDVARHWAPDLVGQDDIVEGSEPTSIAPGVTAIVAPGHTEGHMVFHLDDRWLFTGDTVHWNHRHSELDVTPIQTFYGWEALAATMDVLAQLRVEWVFAGHGSWRHVGFDAYAAEMRELGPSMRRLGRFAWAERPGTPFDWYPFPD